MVRSLARAAQESMESSVPLPAWCEKWRRAQALLYRGAISVVAGPPGSGKTITATNIVNNLRVPTLYISNDSTQYTMVKRAVAMLAGVDQIFAADLIESHPEDAAKILEGWDNIRFNFNSNPTIEEIVTSCNAFREIFGEFPHLLVVDILMNVAHEGVSEQNYWRLFPALKDVAGEQNSAVLAIHHSSQGVKGDPCPPSSAIMGKANQLPELIVTQVMQNGKILYAVVKNRNGPMDDSGQTYFDLPVHPGMNQIDDVISEDGVLFHDGPGVPEHDKIHEDEFA